MLPLEIDVFYHNDKTRPKEDSGIEYQVHECDIKTITIYAIAAITPYLWGEEWYCKIWAYGSGSWITHHTYEQVREMIEKNNQIN